MNFKLPYDSERHNKLREALRNRIKRGAVAVNKKTSDYAKDEERFRAYIPTSQADKRAEAKRDAGKPQFVTLEVPYSFAMLMSFHTYLCSVFLSRTPVLQYTGRHGQTEQQIQAVEAVQDYQTQVGGHMLVYFIWLLDMAKYGVGIVGSYWDEEYIQTSTIEEIPRTYLGIPVPGQTQKKRTTRRVKGFEGNRLFNVRPQDFIFDSRVSLSSFQDGEFCGRYVDLSWNTVKTRETYDQYYNINVLRRKHLARQRSHANGTSARDTGSSQLELPDAITGDDAGIQEDLMSPGFTSGVELQVRLIPKDWGLGPSDYPEMWNFTLAEDDVIIESSPADNLHGKFPYSILEYEIEGYALQKRSMLEILDPLQQSMTWLINTHFYNVRNVLNGQYVIDTSRITMKDFQSEGGGRLIRAKPLAYGTDLRQAIHQLQTADVTQTHLRDMQLIGDLMQRVSGVTDNIMGVVGAGGRKTATEVRGANAFGASRLKIQAEFGSAQGFAPLAQMLLANTQQYYTGEEKFKIAGDLLMEGQEFIQVSPEMIAGAYDFTAVDGSQPVDRFAQVTMWTQLLAQLKNMPQVGAQYDIARIFAWLAQLGGLKNIQRFKINVVSDDTALANAVAGRTQPIGGLDDSGRGTGGSPENSTGVPGAAQLPGLGPAG